MPQLMILKTNLQQKEQGLTKWTKTPKLIKMP